MTKVKILVVDNNVDYRETLATRVLKVEGYEVFQAGNPQEAKEILKKELIHLVILDIRLENDEVKDDFSGLNLNQEIDPDIARIVLTGYRPKGGIDRLISGKVLIPFADRSVELFIVEKNEGPEAVLKAVKKTLKEKFEFIPKLRIAVLTSGGDSPGMNAAIRAIVRIAMDNDVEVIGIQDGYKGLVNNWMRRLTWNEVSDIHLQSGTILGTARFPEFTRADVRKKAVENLILKHITGLIVIGGDGSMKGAQELVKDLKKKKVKMQTIAIPGTIDNDLWGTDMSLGSASAVNAMIEEIKNMLWTAKSIRRIFVCEVMGRYCGYPALGTALGVGADAVIIPEQVIQIRSNSTDSEPLKDRINVSETVDRFFEHLKGIANILKEAFTINKSYGFVIMGEGIRLLAGNYNLNIETIRQFLDDEIKSWSISDKPGVRAHVVGYPVRGVSPCRYDLWLGARLGAAAVKLILEDKENTNIMVGWSEEGEYDDAGNIIKKAGIITTSFDDVLAKNNRTPQEIWQDHPKWQELLEMHEALTCPPELREILKERRNRFLN